MFFQIQDKRSDGSASFCYFEADNLEDAKVKAEETANADMQKRIENDKFRMFSQFNPFKPKRVLNVVEFDKSTKATKRGGIKFKLELAFLEVKYVNGKKSRSEWYRAY